MSEMEFAARLSSCEVYRSEVLAVTFTIHATKIGFQK